MKAAFTYFGLMAALMALALFSQPPARAVFMTLAIFWTFGFVVLIALKR